MATLQHKTRIQAPLTLAAENPAVPLEVAGGRVLQDWHDVPYEVKLAASQRFGRSVILAVAQENGAYRGEVLNLESYMAQRISSSCAILHPKKNLQLASETLVWMAANRRLNGTALYIKYEGSQGSVFPCERRQPDRDKWIASLKKTALDMKIAGYEQFVATLDKLQAALAERAEDEPEKAVR
jgi:hypothetical protein